MTWVNVDIDPGVVREATPYDRPGCWWDTSNVRWVSNSIMPIGGNTRISPSAMPSKVRKLFQWRDNSSAIWLAVGHEAGVRVEYGGDFDVTPTSFVGISGVGGSGFGAGPYSDPTPISDPSGTTAVKNSTVTITIASPAVVTWTAHGLTSDDVVKFTTTVALPTGITAGSTYYVKPIDANTFQICTTGGGKMGTSINTSGTQSGVHTCTQYVGQDTYGRQRSTSAPQFSKPDFWSFASFGQDLLAVCSSDGRLLHMGTSTGSPVQMDVPSAAPVGNTAVLVTAERSVVLLGSTGAGTGGNKRRVAWSDFENFNGWMFNTTGGQAGYIDIEATSPIVNGIRVKEGILILTQHEAFLMRYVGAPYFYGIEKLGATAFSAPNAIAIGGNMAVWYGDEGFWVYDGASVRNLPCPFLSDIKSDLDPTYWTYRAFMHENGVFTEFWFDYPDKTQTNGENNRYLIWNYAENWWARGSRSVTAECGAQTAKYPVGAKTDLNIYQFEDGLLDGGASRIGTVWAESSLLDFGAVSSIVDINQALVAADTTYGSNNYQLKIFSRFAGDQSETTYGPYIPRSTGYTDMRATGKDLRMRIEATSDSYWSLGPVRFDVNAGGGER
jgi:hypothetical protein